MASLHQLPQPSNRPPSFEEYAATEIAYIRSTIERSGRFTAISGWGGIFMGGVAFFATALAGGRPLDGAWLALWLGAALVAGVGNAWALVRKARREGISLTSGLGRNFLLSLCPPLAVGGVLTLVMARAGRIDELPAIWLLLYGAAVMSAGAFSVAVVPISGAVFLALGTMAALGPSAWGPVLLAVGFGGMHLVFGYWVATRHGG